MELLAQYHPLLVHFPIVLFVLYFVFESSGIIFDKEYLLKSAVIILVLGVAGALEAVLTGNQAAQLLDAQGLLTQDINKIIEAHEDWATITLWYYVIVLALRVFLTVNKKFVGKLRYIFVVLSLVGIFFIYKTGEYGGKLVYEYGAGTKFLIEKDK
ncbi:MAG: hypothetical protein GXO85_05675 [Chlorobi bacterium]|nr:hypothetical protein [Chlorobiota bacterium]